MFLFSYTNDDGYKYVSYLTLKVPRKKASKNVVRCKLLPNITDELSIEANSVDPEQTAPIGGDRRSLTWVHTVCH